MRSAERKKRRGERTRRNGWCGVSGDASQKFSHVGDFCGLSDCVSEVSSGVPVVTDVPVSPSSSVVVISAALASDSDSEFVEPQVFSFSKKPSIVCVENQEEMSHEGNARKSTTDIQKHSRARTRQSRPCSGKLRWRTREPVGMLVTERSLRKWRST